MNFSKLPTIAAFTALCLTDCSEETGVAADAIDGISGNEIPGGEFPGSSAMFPGGDIPGSSAIFPRSSSSSPWHQYSSGTVNPGGNESGDDENDLEDARTLNGTQILLKLAGTTTAGTAPAARRKIPASMPRSVRAVAISL